MPILYAEMSSVRPPRIFWPLLGLGIVLPVYGVVALVLHLFGPVGNEFTLLSLSAPLATLVVGLPAWWLFVVKPRHATVPRGMLVGALSSIIAHPVMWLGCVILIRMPIPISLGAPIEAATQVLSFMASWTIVSLVFTGWITLPFGCVIGLLLIYFQRSLTYASQLRIGRKAEAIQRRERSSIEQTQKEKSTEKSSIDDTSEYRA